MRIIRVDDDDRGGNWAWVAVGIAAGLVGGVLISERMNGRPISVRALMARGRRLASAALERWEPLLEAALSVRDAWESEDEEEEEEEEGEDEAVEGEAEEEESELDTGSDDGLDARVLVAFEQDPVLSGREIEIEDRDGEIILHGRVHSAREVQHAVTIARGVPGVASVRQRLRRRDDR